MDSALMLDSAAEDGRALLSAAERDWSCPVAHCPGWDAAELVRHTGAILAWMSAIVTTRGRQSRRALPAPPEDSAALAGWYSQQLAGTISILGATDPTTETWTFSTLGDNRLSWWRRRLAVEVAIHRWDAEHAAGLTPAAIGGGVAECGIAEFMTEFLAGLLTDHRDTTGIKGTLHLHATDGDSEWWADLDHPGTVAAEHRKADMAIRGTRSDLLLWLANRQASDEMTVLGEPTLVGAWSALSR